MSAPHATRTRLAPLRARWESTSQSVIVLTVADWGRDARAHNRHLWAGVRAFPCRCRVIFRRMGRIRRQLEPVLRDITINAVINGRIIPNRQRGRMLASVGHDIDPSAYFCPDGFIGARKGLTVGANTFINYGWFFDLRAPTTIGRGCALGYQVMLITGTHEPGSATRRAGAVSVLPITIGDGVWVGARVTVLPGVTIADGCVIAAGAVVAQDCAAHGLYAGIPARRIRDLLR